MQKYCNFPLYMSKEGSNVDPNAISIKDFYAERDIFITGGSGFMGRVLIEKLLRSCPNVGNLYILLREKKGATVEERIKILQELPLFETLKNSNPKAFDKMVPIDGDVTKIGLGLSEADIERMQNVSIIFHVAASVRFDDPLKYATLLNTRGTREVVYFAEKQKNLCVMMHVSTTYCNPDHHIIEERIYPEYADWSDTIRIAETMNEDLIDTLSVKYMSFMPNTYTFTKSMAEHIINDYKDRLPLIIFRPSIVISTMKDPIPGWIDNFNGPLGLLVGCGIGITRTMYCDPDNIADYTPVDVCIKAMIVAVWKRGIKPIKPDEPKLPIYNCSTSNQRACTMEQIVDLGKVLTNEVALDKQVWAPGGRITYNRFLNYLKVIFFHILPALVIDLALRMSGKRPFLTNLQRRVYTANCALEYFILSNWDFKNDNFLKLNDEIKPEDDKDFYFRDFIVFDIMLYFRNCILGARRYLLHEKDENIPKALKKYQKLKKLDYLIKAIIYSLLTYFLLIRTGLLHTIFTIGCSKTAIN